MDRGLFLLVLVSLVLLFASVANADSKDSSKLLAAVQLVCSDSLPACHSFGDVTKVEACLIKNGSPACVAQVNLVKKKMLVRSE